MLPRSKIQSHVSAGGISQALGIHIETAACDDTVFHQMLNALMYGSARYAALCCDILERNARILRQYTQNLFVEIVNFVHFPVYVIKFLL
jgi:hypothetical protein